MDNHNSYQLTDYKKFLLTRLSVTNQIIEYIATVKTKNSVHKKHTFHKIIIHKWTFSSEELFNTMRTHYQEAFLPVNYQNLGNISTFYTSKIALIAKICRMDFMFPFQNTMFSVDIVFNDKSSIEMFGVKTTLENIVEGVVCKRFTEKYELDLSNFSKDPDFVDNKIHYYKVSMLGRNQNTMKRMARDVKILNLSDNKLSAAPFKLMNYFLKSDITEVNLSYNEILSIGIIRLTPTIEKLWLEGNPLCDDYTPLNYVKVVHKKFPLLTELDGIPINQYGVTFPLWRNYLPDNDRKIKMLVEKFVMLYFTHYDTYRTRVADFYAEFAKFSLSTSFTGAEELKLPHYLDHARNALHIVKKGYIAAASKLYGSRMAINNVFASLKDTKHDPTTFTIDVAKFDTGAVMVVIDGVYKETGQPNQPATYFQFRRTFVIAPVPSDYASNYKVPATTNLYCITNEMLSLNLAEQEMKERSFQVPIRNLNSYELINPTQSEKDKIVSILSDATGLKKEIALKYLEEENWNFKDAIVSFSKKLRFNNINKLHLRTDRVDSVHTNIVDLTADQTNPTVGNPNKRRNLRSII